VVSKSIIVEGPDASGKSTLATRLSEYYGLYVFRAGPRPVDREHAEVCMIYQTAWLSKTQCIWDRVTPISNACNMPPLDEADTLAHAHYLKVMMQHAVIVMCTAENLENHVLEPSETPVDDFNMRRDRQIVLNNYAKFAHDLPGVIRYNFKVRTFRDLIDEIDYEISTGLQRSKN
jgi:hypothetical protein